MFNHTIYRFISVLANSRGNGANANLTDEYSRNFVGFLLMLFH